MLPTPTSAEASSPPTVTDSAAKSITTSSPAERSRSTSTKRPASSATFTAEPAVAVSVITGSVGQVPSTSSSVPAQERAAPYATGS